MEVIHLNAEGLKKYCEVYGDTIYNVSTDFKGIPDAWKMDTADGVAEVFIKHRSFKIQFVYLSNLLVCLLFKIYDSFFRLRNYTTK